MSTPSPSRKEKNPPPTSAPESFTYRFRAKDFGELSTGPGAPPGSTFSVEGEDAERDKERERERDVLRGKEKDRERAESKGEKYPSVSAENAARRMKQIEKAKLTQMTRQLQMRLQYARLKVEHGWIRQNLNEVENLYFHHYRARPTPYPLPSTSSSAPPSAQQTDPAPNESSTSLQTPSRPTSNPYLPSTSQYPSTPSSSNLPLPPTPSPTKILSPSITTPTSTWKPRGPGRPKSSARQALTPTHSTPTESKTNGSAPLTYDSFWSSLSSSASVSPTKRFGSDTALAPPLSPSSYKSVAFANKGKGKARA